MRHALFAVMLPALVGCESGDLNSDWFHWDIDVVGVADDCHESPAGYAEGFTYSLEFVGGGSETVLRIGEDPFAIGTFTGCKLSYDSGVVREELGDGSEEWVQWRLTSTDTVIRQGGQACDIESEILEGISRFAWSADEGWDYLQLDFEASEADWFGFETFEIRGVGQDIEELEIGCEYTVLVAGTYVTN
jgi:hypothetical protein